MIDGSFAEQDNYETGKDALRSIADLGASRAGRLVWEIQHELAMIRAVPKSNLHRSHHLEALFAEFITGEDYDIAYYNKPKVMDDDRGSDMVQITWENIDEIEKGEDHEYALERLESGEDVWVDKTDMSLEWCEKENVKHRSCASKACEGCSVCWDKARKDLLDAPIKKKWYQETIMDITPGWKVSLVGALIATGILGLCSLFAALIVYSEIVA